MNDATALPLIDVDELRIGMFVHLDGGWMSHPFPLSSFKIGAAVQITTIRSLGKRRVRWSPDKSDAEAALSLHGDEHATIPAGPAVAPAATAAALNSAEAPEPGTRP